MRTCIGGRAQCKWHTKLAMIAEIVIAVVLCVLGAAARAWGLCSRTLLRARLHSEVSKPQYNDGKEPPEAPHGRHSVGDKADDLTFSRSATFCPTAAGAVQPESDTSRLLIGDSVPCGAVVAAGREAHPPSVAGKDENLGLAATSSPTTVPMFPSEPSASSASALSVPFSTTLTPHPAPDSKPTCHPSSLSISLATPTILQPHPPQCNHHHHHHHHQCNQLSRLSLDTIRQPDDQLAALQYARKVMHQASCMRYTPTFTVGRVALKIPDRHVDDLPPLETWTAPFRSALSTQGVGLLGVYVRQGCIQLVLDLVALAYGGGPVDGAAAAQVGSPAAHLLQGAGAGSSGSAGLGAATAQGGEASSSRSPSGGSDRLGVVQPGVTAPPRHVSHSAPTRSRSDGNVMSSYRQRQQHRRRPARGNQSWSVDSQGHRSPQGDYLGWAVEGAGDGMGRPRAGAGPRCVRRSSANAAELRNYGTSSSSGSASPVEYPPPELMLPPDHPLRAVLSEFPPEAWVDLLGESLGGGGQVVTVQLPGASSAAVQPDAAGAATWHVTLGDSLPAAPAPGTAAELPHLLCVSPMCVVAGLAGPLIMYAAGTDLQGLEWEASTARGAGGGGGGRVRGAGGPAGMAATGEEARRGVGRTGSGSSCYTSSPREATRGSGPVGVGGAAAGGRSAGPSVHVRYRGGHLPCRASLLGDQLPAEALSRVLPLHALQRAEVVCLQLPAPPPLPGVMFVECQRGGLVGAPQPVLVAPSLGVWQEVSSLVGSGAAVPGAGMPGLLDTSQAGVMQGMLLDCGMWFEFQANLQLLSMPSAAHLATRSMGEQQLVHAVGQARAGGRVSADAAAGAAAAASGTIQARAGPSAPGRQFSSAPGQPVSRSLTWLLEAAQRPSQQELGQGATRGSAVPTGGGNVANAARAQERREAASCVVPFLAAFPEAAVRLGDAETDRGVRGTGSSPQATAGSAAVWPGSEPALARARTSTSELAAAAAQAEDFMQGVSDPVGMAGARVRSFVAPGPVATAAAAARGECAAALRPAAPAAADAAATAPMRARSHADLLAERAVAGAAAAAASAGVTGAETASRATSLLLTQTTVNLEGLYGSAIVQPPSPPPPQGPPPPAPCAGAAAPATRQPAPYALRTGPYSATPCAMTPAAAPHAAMATGATALNAEVNSVAVHGSTRGSFEQPGRGRERTRGAPLSRQLQRQHQPEGDNVGANPYETLLDAAFAAALGASERRQAQGGKGQAAEYVWQRSYSELRSWDSMTDVCVEIGDTPRRFVGEAAGAAEGQLGTHTRRGGQVQEELAAAAAAAATAVPRELAKPSGMGYVDMGVGGGGEAGALRVVAVGGLRRVVAVGGLRRSSSSGSNGRAGVGNSSDPLMMSSRLQSAPELRCQASQRSASQGAWEAAGEPTRGSSCRSNEGQGDGVSDEAEGGCSLVRSGRAVARAPARRTSSAATGSTQVFLRTVSSSCFLHQPHTVSHSNSSDPPQGPPSQGVPAASLVAAPHAMDEALPATAAAIPTATGAGIAEQRPSIPYTVDNPRFDGGGRGGVFAGQVSQLAAARGELGNGQLFDSCAPTAGSWAAQASLSGTTESSSAPVVDAAHRSARHEEEQYFHDLDPFPAPHTHRTSRDRHQQHQQHQQQTHSAPTVPQPAPAAGPGATAGTAVSAAPPVAAGPAAPTDPWVTQPHFHTRLRHLGVQLLSFAALRGWPHTLSELLAGLARVGIDLYDADQLVGEREGGLRLLHLAVMSGSADAARAVLRAAAAAGGASAGGGGVACDVEAPGPAGLTPLHLAAALEDGGQVAWVLLESSPAALQHWFEVHAADGATPADMATQARMDGLNQLVRLRMAAVAAAAAARQQQQQQQGAQGGSGGGAGHGEEGAVAVASAFSTPAPPQGQQQQKQEERQEQHTPCGRVPVEQLHAVGAPAAASSSRAASSTPWAAAPAELRRRTAAQHPNATPAEKYTFESGPVHPDAWSAGLDTLGEKDSAAGLRPTPVPRLGAPIQLLACSLWGDVRPAMEARFRLYHAQALARVDATCGAVFVVLFALPAIGLLLSGDTAELISHLIFNAGLLGPYLLRLMRPRAFLVHRDALMLMVEATKLLLLLLVLSGILPYPKAWSNFTKGNMDIIMLVIIKPLAEQTVFPVAVVQRLVGIFVDAHIYAHISYGGAMVPSLVRAAVQNAVALLLLLAMDVRARWVFERAAVRRQALGNSPSGFKGALVAIQ